MHDVLQREADKVGQCDGSVGKATCHQAWQPEFTSGAPHGGRREKQAPYGM